MNTKDLAILEKQKSLYQALETPQIHVWCSGCGNYAISAAFRRALILEEVDISQSVFCYDIGCQGNGADKINAFSFHGLHGRVLPFASGIKIANPSLRVFAFAGDGGTFSEGMAHLLFCLRNDYPFVFILHDNQNFALTTGQPSSVTPFNYKLHSRSVENILPPFNPLSLVLSQDPSFVAQTLSANIDHMTETFRVAMSHKGFAFVRVKQTCPTYNKEHSNAWYLERAVDISQNPEYKNNELSHARDVALWDENVKFPIGVLYQNPQKKNFFDITGTKPNFSPYPKQVAFKNF